jgi:hypothetical protein
MDYTAVNSDKSFGVTTSMIEGQLFFKIIDVDQMRPFFMSLVSDVNHWMFLSSNGGITAGRKNAQLALFPYYTDDKITSFAEHTGSKTIIKAEKENESYFWEPFSEKLEGKYKTTRNLYKSALGNKVIFEEINHDLQLSFQFEWNFGATYGFIKKSSLKNLQPHTTKVTILDGLQNILPYGVSSDLQTKSSNLVDAYKRAELDIKSGLGIFALSAIITDKAEPSESLRANVAYALGLKDVIHLLSSLQLDTFRKGVSPVQEVDVKAEQGAYLISSSFDMEAHTTKEWLIVANVNLDQSEIIELTNNIVSNNNLIEDIQQDINEGTIKLRKLVAAADGTQLSSDTLTDSRHYSNVLFNIMRGGIFDDNYNIEKNDFVNFLSTINRDLYNSYKEALKQYPETTSLLAFKERIGSLSDVDMERLANEYLPLKFSRRHGDPSRPWNVFTINTHSELDGSKILDYEGNWRDIFQNWEALVHSYPLYIEGMISKFLNSSTFDGYNPYRVTKTGFDWETIEADDEWSFIGYWGDHQVIYLLKLLEFANTHMPHLIPTMMQKSYFVYANVPYKIKPYSAICINPKDTIDFDHQLDHDIKEKIKLFGSDAALLHGQSGEILHVNFVEKILVVVLAKFSNFVIDGGIWLNTQRPEWNDANNALVGNGTSMVTLCYLRRFMSFLNNILEHSNQTSSLISVEVYDYFKIVESIFDKNIDKLNGPILVEDRKSILDALGKAASDYRISIYDQSFSGIKVQLETKDLISFSNTTLSYIDQSIKTNRREDGLYHGYNLLTFDGAKASISHLQEMLEGQVAVLSAGVLSPSQCLEVCDGLRRSSLYRADQMSYILYPNKALPGFLQKNSFSEDLIGQYLEDQNIEVLLSEGIFKKDIQGTYHFNSSFKNGNELNDYLSNVTVLSKEKKQALGLLFEAIFDHKSFTGRSGTFYGYEGLGSIYWHMVSKLRLAVLENCYLAAQTNVDESLFTKLALHYYEIADGIGVHKTPELYGAFPTDPYSHTPMNKGAQQPGMTGQVKEDILCRMGELGVLVRDGNLMFCPILLKTNELLSSTSTFEYFDVNGDLKYITTAANSLAFTYCQVPVIYALNESKSITLYYENGDTLVLPSQTLDATQSMKIFSRSGKVTKIVVGITKEQLLNLD